MNDEDHTVALREAPGVRDVGSGRDVTLGRDARGRFAPGNPGRPFGTRNRVSARVARAILADFEANQDDTLLRLRRWFLPQYVAMISRLLPRDGESDGMAAPPDAPSLADLRGLIDQLEANGGDLQARLLGVSPGAEPGAEPGADAAGTDIIGR